MVKDCSEDGALCLVTVADWPPQIVVIAALALLQAVSDISLPPGAGLQPTCNPQAHSSWGLWADVAVVGSHSKTVDPFPFFNDYRRHLRTLCCFWVKSGLWVCMGASIMNEAVTGSAGFPKTCCWWRCLWETWCSADQAVQPYGMCIGSPWQLAGAGFLAYGSCRQHEVSYASKTTSLNIWVPWRGLEELENMVAKKAASGAQFWILWQCRYSQKLLKNVAQDQADTDLLVFPTKLLKPTVSAERWIIGFCFQETRNRKVKCAYHMDWEQELVIFGLF